MTTEAPKKGGDKAFVRLNGGNATAFTTHHGFGIRRYLVTSPGRLAGAPVH